MRISTAMTPRLISCFEELDKHVALPRGCFGNLHALLEEHKVNLELEDKRFEGELHNLSRSFRIVREKVGLDDVRFHDLRHTAGSRMAQSGVDIYTIAKILGHKTLTMTIRYSHYNVESLRCGVDTLAGQPSVTVLQKCDNGLECR